MATSIPAKQLQTVGETPDELKSRLLNRETGWCKTDKALYFKDEEELHRVGGSSLPEGGAAGQVLKKTQNGAAWGDVTLENGKTIDGFAEEVAEEFDRLKSKGCIYFNKETGSDDNDGLTRETPVKTEQKLVELLREKEYDRIFLTKTIGSSEGSDDDSGASEVVIDTGITYKWKRLYITGEGCPIKVIFGEVADAPAPSSEDVVNLDAVLVESKSGISVTGTMTRPVSLSVFAEYGTVQILDDIAPLQLNIKAAELILRSPISTAELHVDAKVLAAVEGRFEICGYGYEDTQSPWTTALPTSNSTIKADTLNWSGNDQGIITFNMRDQDTSVRNLDVQISTLIMNGQYLSGKCCPILGPMDYYNGEVTGEIGSIVIVKDGQIQKRSRWAHDLIFYDTDSDSNSIVSRHWKPTARVSLHLADRSSPSDIFIDLDQGDDRYDGLTANRAVRSIRGLYRALKLNFNPSYNHSGGMISFYTNPVSLHILSGAHSNRGHVNIPPTSADLNLYVDRELVGDDDLVQGKSYDLNFQFLEVLPEAPNLSITLGYLNTTVFATSGFKNFCVRNFHNSNGCSISVYDQISINNIKEEGQRESYYDYSITRVGYGGWCNFTGKNITLYGKFHNLYADATQNVVIDDNSTGPYSDGAAESTTGVTVLKAGESAYVGQRFNGFRISGNTTIEACSSINGGVRSITGSLSIACKSMFAKLGTGYMRAGIRITADDVWLNGCFNGNSYGGNFPGSEVWIRANRVIGSSDIPSYYYMSFHIDCLELDLPMAIYSNSGGVLDINAKECKQPISVHAMKQMNLDIGIMRREIIFLSGGPYTPSAQVDTTAVIKIGKFLDNSGYASTCLLTIMADDSQYIRKDITLDVGHTDRGLINWANGTSFSPTYIRAKANSSSVEGDSAYSNLGKSYPANADCVITILNRIISADVDIVSKSVTVATGSTSGSVTLDNYKYNEIAAVPAEVTDLTINVPAASAGKLQECAFQFSLPDNAALTSVIAKMRAQKLPMITPSTFASGKIYQGTSVNGLVTIAEFTAPQGVVIGGRFYPTVTIGNQEWLAENLDFKFSGLDIGPTGDPATSAAWYYDNDESTYGVNGNRYGLLYNWYAAKYLDDNKATLLPDGWHVPTPTEWGDVAPAVGGAGVAGTKLKSTTGWSSGNGDGSYGFEAVPTGYRDTGSFYYLGSTANFWTANEHSSTYAYGSNFSSGASMNSNYYLKTYAFSVRLVRTIS